MIEIKDIENAKVGTIPEAKTIIVSIDSNMNVVDMFNVLVNSGIMDNKEMYELGSYLKTFADFHAPVESANKPVPRYGYGSF